MSCQSSGTSEIRECMMPLYIMSLSSSSSDLFIFPDLAVLRSVKHIWNVSLATVKSKWLHQFMLFPWLGWWTDESHLIKRLKIFQRWKIRNPMALKYLHTYTHNYTLWLEVFRWQFCENSSTSLYHPLFTSLALLYPRVFTWNPLRLLLWEQTKLRPFTD